MTYTEDTYASIRQHTPAYASVRQHTSAYVSIYRDCLKIAARKAGAVDIYRGHIRQHTPAYASIRGC